MIELIKLMSEILFIDFDKHSIWLCFMV